MINKIIQANAEIEKVLYHLKENKKAFDYMDVKLHDVSYYCYKDALKDFPLFDEKDFNGEYGFFYQFCEVEYDFMEEYLMENKGIKLNDMRHQLGRTSSFYLHDRNRIDITHSGIDYQNTIISFIEYGCSSTGLMDDYINQEGKIDIPLIQSIDEEDKEEIETELDYIIEHLYKYYMEYVEDIVFVYTELKEFKDNQVDTFKEFLKNIHNEKEEELRLEQEKEREDTTKLAEIIKNKKLTIQDAKEISQVIYTIDKVEGVLKKEKSKSDAKIGLDRYEIYAVFVACELYEDLLKKGEIKDIDSCTEYVNIYELVSDKLNDYIAYYESVVMDGKYKCIDTTINDFWKKLILEKCK